MGYRIGIDVGGTFTDLMAFNDTTGQILPVKTPSTPNDPSEGVLNIIHQFLNSSQGSIDLIVHASTIGTNLFLGQQGLDMPRGALITTRGFRDILEIGRQKRAELYNPFFQKPKPLIERDLRFTVDERIDAKGNILTNISTDELHTLVESLREKDVDTIAVVFLHSYINPIHEKKAADILRRELPKTVIVASYEVDPVYREFERTSTTVINSLLIPIVSSYSYRIKEKLQKANINVPIYMMQSNGGLANLEIAAKLPVATIESGPATGVTATACWSQMMGIERVLSFDMGGTTAKAGVIIDGKPQMVDEYEIGGKIHGGRAVKGSGYPVRHQFVDLAEVSGGGGTIAWVDRANALMVGPVSAGADPGPACYGKGGRNATVTDANLALGRLSPEGLSGGTVKIYPELAREAIEVKIAKPLGISPTEAANGIIEIVNNHMMRALRLVSIERGHDPRHFTMLAFGGSGPMHAAFLAEGLDIRRVIIPANSGVFSALGLLLADFRHDFLRNILQESDAIDPELLEAVFRKMESEARDILAREGFPPSQTRMERELGIRYTGQSYELMIPSKSRISETVEQFHLRHYETYGYAARGEPTEIVNAHLTAWGLISKPAIERHPLGSASHKNGAIRETRKVFFPLTKWVETPIFRRDQLDPGNRIAGPAIIEQYDATTVVPPGWEVLVDEFLNLCLLRDE